MLGDQLLPANDPALAPPPWWHAREVYDPCSEQEVPLPERVPPLEYCFSTCPVWAAQRFPRWIRELPGDYFHLWRAGQGRWPGGLAQQPRKWLDAMHTLDDLARRLGLCTDPTMALANALIKFAPG